MTVVFVHGNPETPAIWDHLAARLAEAGYRDQVRLAPAGFDAPVPVGFGSTAREYRDWLLAELAQFAEPIDLVGHDLGGGFVVDVMTTRPELVRSWASDAVGVFDPDYVWHDLAQVWQTPGDGEAWIARSLSQTPAERAAGTATLGLDPVIGTRIGAGFDEAMGESILRFYRATPQSVLASIGANLEVAVARPGLTLLPSEDPFCGTDEQRRRSAARAGAQVAELPGLGHWWMTQGDGRPAAAALIKFWDSL